MSTYLVAFVVGPLEATEPIHAGGVPIRVVHRPGQGDRTSFALDVAAAALDWFADYYAIPYPSDKVDLIAIPDFAFGAMENLGCVTFREVLLSSTLPTQASPNSNGLPTSSTMNSPTCGSATSSRCSGGKGSG